MKATLSYKSKRNIIIVVIIIALLALISTGTYFLMKGNADASAAFTDNGNKQVSEGTTNNPEQQQPDNVQEPQTPEQSQEQNVPQNQGTTTNQGSTTTNLNAGTANVATTTTTTGNVPNQEYVTERVEQQEVIVRDYAVAWNPLAIVANVTDTNIVTPLDIVKPVITAEKTANVEATEGENLTYTITVKNSGLVDGTAIVKDQIPEGTEFVENSIKVNDEETQYTAEDLTNGIEVAVAKIDGTAKLSFDVKVKLETVGTIENIAEVNEENTNKVETNVTDTIKPVVILNGVEGNKSYFEETIEADKTATYEDLGAKVIDNVDADATIEKATNINYVNEDGTVTAVDKVDMGKPGEYRLGYTYTDAAGNAAMARRIVKVVDTTKPEVFLNGVEGNKVYFEETIEADKTATYEDLGAKVIDNVDADATIEKATNINYVNEDGTVTAVDKVDMGKPGEYRLGYTYTDAAGNVAMARRIVKVVDTTKPVVLLNGVEGNKSYFEETIEADREAIYEDLGARVTDNVDADATIEKATNINYVNEDGTVTAVDKVDMGKPGEYRLGYTYTDAAGNKAMARRIVKVVDTIGPEIIFPDAVIGLNNNELYYEAGCEFTLEGLVTVKDKVDPNPTLKITEITYYGGPNKEDNIYNKTEEFLKNGLDTKLTGENNRGRYNIDYLATDALGNETKRTLLVMFKDNVAPVLEIDTKNSIGKDGYYKKMVVKATDNAYLAYYEINGKKSTIDNNIIGVSTHSRTFLNETINGHIKFNEKNTIAVYDKAGNKSNVIEFIADQEGPEIIFPDAVIGLNNNELYYEAGCEFTLEGLVTAKDKVDPNPTLKITGITYYGGPNKEDNIYNKTEEFLKNGLDTKLTGENNRGRYNIDYLATDALGNETKRTLLVMFKDNVAPVLEIDTKNSIGKDGYYKKMVVKATDNAYLAYYEINGKKSTIDNNIIGVSTHSRTFLNETINGHIKFNEKNTIVVYDKAGNKSNVIEFIADQEAPKCVSINVKGSNKYDNQDKAWYVKNGEYVEVYVRFDEELSVAPILKIEGIDKEIKLNKYVVGNDVKYGIRLQITSEDKIADGEMKIEISGYEDKVGNVGRPLTNADIKGLDSQSKVIIDRTAPLIKLNGQKNMTLEAGIDKYKELGATVTDSVDGTITNLQPEFIHYSVNGKYIEELTDVKDIKKPGTYKIVYKYTDKAGNIGVDADDKRHTYAMRIVTIADTKAPVIKLKYSNNAKETTIGNDPYFQEVSFNFEDRYMLDKYIINGTTKDFTNDKWSNANYKDLKQFLKEGENTIILVDAAGNRTEKKFTMDWTAPEATIKKSNNDKSTNKDVTVTLTANEEVSCPEGWTENENNKGHEFTKVYSENGKYSVTIKDKAGNETVVKFEVKRIDKVAPEATIKKSNNDGSTNEDVTVTLTANEAIYCPEGWTENKNNKEHEFTKVYSENGKYSVTIKDKAGNETVVKFEVKRIDKVAPKVTVVDPNKYKMLVNTEYVEKGYSAYDAVDKDLTASVKLQYQFQAAGTSTWSFVDTLDTSKLGTYKIIYNVKDKSGNEAKGTRVVQIVETLE